MNHDFLDDQSYKLWILLNQAKDMMFKARGKELSRYGISVAHSAVLFVIKVLNDTKGKATPNEIARWLLREPHSVSRILVRMENEGLVSRTSSLGKKNEVRITFTEKGEQAYSQSSKRESIREIISCLSEEERQQLDSLLRKIRDKGLKSLTEISKLPFP